MSEPIAVDISALEAAMLARLEAKIDGYAIEPFDDNPETYKIKHQKGAFLISYRGADYSPTDDTGDVVQERRMMMDVTVVCRQLSGQGNSYTMIELARVALTGHVIPGFTKLAMMRERFVAFKEGTWLYALTFAASTVAVESPDDMELTNTTRITADSSLGSSQVPQP